MEFSAQRSRILKAKEKMKNNLNREEKMKKIISDHLGISVKDITPHAHLKQDLNAENVEIADLLMILEKEFSVNLSSDEAKNINTVSDIFEAFQ